jgi:peptidyl-prolyl cis-trans isomerase C
VRQHLLIGHLFDGARWRACELCILGVTALLLLAACDPAQPVANVDSGARKVAVFEGGQVTKGELDEQIEAFSQQVGQEIPPDSPQYQQAVAQVMPQLMAQEVTRAYARENGIEATQADVERAVDQEMELIRQQVAQQAPDQDPDEVFQQALEQNNITEAQLRRQIERQLKQTDVPLIRKVEERVVEDAGPSERDIERFYEENKQAQYMQPARRCARHILLGPDQKDKAEEVRQRLEGGGDFGDLAKEFSQDTGSAENGGDLGCLGRGETVPNFDEALFGAEEGELVGPVETRFGYHVIEVTEIRKESTTPLDEVETEIREQLSQQRRSEEFQRWIDGEIKKRDVKYLPGYAPQGQGGGSGE